MKGKTLAGQLGEARLPAPPPRGHAGLAEGARVQLGWRARGQGDRVLPEALPLQGRVGRKAVRALAVAGVHRGLHLRLEAPGRNAAVPRGLRGGPAQERQEHEGRRDGHPAGVLRRRAGRGGLLRGDEEGPGADHLRRRQADRAADAGAAEAPEGVREQPVVGAAGVEARAARGRRGHDGRAQRARGDRGRGARSQDVGSGGRAQDGHRARAASR